MKIFRIMNIMDTVMQVTNQRVAIFDLSEVEYEDFSLPSGIRPYTFDSETERYVIDFNSYIAQNFIQSANAEEIIEIDLSNFYSRIEHKGGRSERIYYHNLS